MKKTFGLLIFCLAVGSMQAQSLLVTVELVDNARIENWLEKKYPTYEFIDNKAIAEIIETDMVALRAQGYVVEVIDYSPWSGSYYLSEVSVDLEVAIPGDIIWQGTDISLIEISEQQKDQMYKLPLRFQPLKKKQLPERFWRQVLSKMVPLHEVRWDPFIQNIVDQVSTDSITAYIQRLQDFRTRLALHDSSFAASEWMRQKFTAWGLSAAFDSFYMTTNWPGSGYERNVIATMPGSLIPSRIVIIGGHHDAIVWWDTTLASWNAPGADDNASGTVAAMEAARIFRNYSWDPTVQFITWGAEELGLFGSYHYAERADSLDLDIGAVLNFDMIGYMDDANLDCIIQRRSSAPLWLSNLFYEVGQTYVAPLEIYRVTSGGGSDWYPFAVHGFPAVGGAERAGSFFNPHYHDTTDLLSTMTPSLYTNIVKTGVAALAVLSLYPSPVEDLLALDLGTGSDVQLTWTSSPESDVIGYRIYWGLQSEVYIDSLFLSGGSSDIDTINGLLNDSTYYITIRALDSDGNPSYASYEVTCTPRLVPFAPSGIIATPISSGIRIDWLPNEELDLAGYRLYRRLNENPTYDSLNTTLLTDTTYTDHPLSGADRYYYALRAFDLAGNYSDFSTEAYGRPVTLDQGVLIVDETSNGTNPPDSLQDAFYDYIMSNYTHTEYEYGNTGDAPVLADFVPYSSILWHADDYTQQYAGEHIEDFIQYLDFGGNILFVGWRPTANLEGATTYPFNFNPGTFMYEYMRISHVEITMPTDSFQAADGLLGYPRLEVDSVKVPFTTWNGALRYIEGLTAVTPAEVIYTMDMRNNTSPYEGAVCGVRFLGNDYNTVFFAFPLYFMDEDQARTAADKVMTDFGEVGIAEAPKGTVVFTDVLLNQNLPNPFSEQTLINYNLRMTGNVRLQIYNIAGQLVKTLVDTHQGPGSYSIVWAGTDELNRRVSSGVYFCRLETDDQSAIKKLTILR
ncbi:MAG: M20/M25/M40 family metallo-hydrolase [candidate division WOR-3 bacterium]|nr:MAG: M20/M25/M40 family metallo-hydrolase [candidate division WOR-3 bacterium]